MPVSALHRYPPVLIRADEAERLDSIGHVLLADSTSTDGALTSHRVALARGADGAMPHRHDERSELFYILDGAFDLLIGNDVLVARTGDLLIVPPRMAHAFAAHHGCCAEALVIATPGIERFDYFRHVVRLRAGAEPPQVLQDLEDQFDTHFLASPAWQHARSSVVRSTGESHDH